MVSSYLNTPDFLPKFLGVGSHLDEPVLVYAGELTPARHYVQSSRTTKVELVVQWHWIRERECLLIHIVCVSLINFKTAVPRRSLNKYERSTPRSIVTSTF
jgi:hypothetical protein